MNHLVVFIGESGVDEITSKVAIYNNKFIDTPGFNGSKYTTFVSDIKKVVKDNQVIIVLVVRHDLTRVTDWINNVKDLLDHFVNAKLVVIWNSKHGHGMPMSESLNKKFPCQLIHLDASESNFKSNFHIIYNGGNLLTRWKTDITTASVTAPQSNNVSASKFLSPRIKVENFSNQNYCHAELKNAVKKLCDLHNSDRVAYDDLKVIGDADLRHVAARFLQSKNFTPIDTHLRPIISNDGNMVNVYDEIIKPLMISGTGLNFWKDWENHKKCDFVEALIALKFGTQSANFILSKIVIVNQIS